MMGSETPSDVTLIEEHQRGSSVALPQLWLRYNRLVYGIAHSVVSSREAAEDIRQEVFLKMYQRLGQLEDATKFVSWLRNITYNTCYSWLRRQKPTEPLESLTEDEHPTAASVEVDIEQQELRSLSRQIVDRLPEKYRTVIELRYFEGLRRTQIAEFLGVTESTIKWRLQKAYEVLREMVEKGDCFR